MEIQFKPPGKVDYPARVLAWPGRQQRNKSRTHPLGRQKSQWGLGEGAQWEEEPGTGRLSGPGQP